MTTFSDRLKQAMTNKGMTQTDLSNGSGICKSAISQYLSAKNTPKDKVVERLADALGISKEDLLCTPKTAQVEDTATNVIRFSTKKITLKHAAKVMHMSDKTLAEKMQAGDTTIGEAYRAENSKEWSYYISPKKFYEHTGWCY